MSNESNTGNPSYAGYEYQILVSVWIALDLVLAKEATETVVIEPASHEDVEAMLDVTPEAASSTSVAILAGPIELTFQIKSRSTGAWSSRNFAEILRGKPVSKAKSSVKKKGPMPRLRPLNMLLEDPKRRYIFVTDTGLQAGLMPYAVASIMEWPSTGELPPATRSSVPSAEHPGLAHRIAILSTITSETLESRVRNLLTFHGHVPALNQNACLKDMREQVRMRLLGSSGGRWTREDILGLLVRHGGSLLSTRMLDRYVRPRSFSMIEQKLVDRNAVVIIGPPGTGKTLTGEILEEQYRRSGAGYLIVGGEHGPGYVREQLSLPMPIVFHLRDPWDEPVGAASGALDQRVAKNSHLRGIRQEIHRYLALRHPSRGRTR